MSIGQMLVNRGKGLGFLPVRIAFVTSEYPSELPDAGGLGTHVHRMAKLLLASGHEPEVFVSSDERSESTEYDGVPVNRIKWRENHPVLTWLYRGSAKFLRFEMWWAVAHRVAQAWALAVTLERRHALAPFQLVQSADYLAPGLFVRRRARRVHAVRCSLAADLYDSFDGRNLVKHKCEAYLERLTMRRADVVFAPSRLVADHLTEVHNIETKILRPPSFLERAPSPVPPFTVPERFFFHFGQLIERKGTTLLARALPLAWQDAPDLTMVWSGRNLDERQLAQWRVLWGVHAHQVVISGALRKPDLYAILQRAEAAILPSQIDNLPNTVIESLMLGIPVLGTRGASIDELVDEDKTGHLVALGDVESLAGAMVRLWQGRSPVKRGFVWDSPMAKAMMPERAVARLLALASGAVE